MIITYKKEKQRLDNDNKKYLNEIEIIKKDFEIKNNKLNFIINELFLLQNIDLIEKIDKIK